MKKDTKLRFLVYPLICLIVALPVVVITGCSPATQAKVNTAVQDIENWTPVIASDAQALISDLTSFNPNDAAALNSIAAQIQADVAPIQALCQAYLTNPTATVLTQITNLVTASSSLISTGLLQVLNIKDANSQMIAKGVLTTLATAITILDGILASTGQTASIELPANTQLNVAMLQRALDQFKSEGNAPPDMTVSQAINALQQKGILRYESRHFILQQRNT
jgi:hypothetical protein